MNAAAGLKEILLGNPNFQSWDILIDFDDGKKSNVLVLTNYDSDRMLKYAIDNCYVQILVRWSGGSREVFDRLESVINYLHSGLPFTTTEGIIFSVILISGPTPLGKTDSGALQYVANVRVMAEPAELGHRVSIDFPEKLIVLDFGEETIP